MRKAVYNISNLNYSYDSQRKGAKYRYYDTVLNEYKFGNAGDIAEVALSWALGYGAHKDPNGRDDESSDIEETHTSVKSWYFTLAPIKAETFEAIVDTYWTNVVSTNFSFVWIEGEELVEYNMNADEFNQFLYRFAKYKKSDRVVRGPRLSNKRRQEVEKWLEARA